MRNTCRICNQAFFHQPLLQYENMPAAAQYLPDADSLSNDKSVALEVCQCSGCGLVQLGNDPVHYYKDVIRAAAVSEEMRDFRRKQFCGFVERFSLHKKKVVEIGCGRGEYLSLLQEFTPQAYGVEHLETSVQHCITQGLTVSQGFVEGATQPLDHAPFDAFMILNYLEHLPDPSIALQGICHNLAEGAVGLVEVPNFDMMLKKNLFSEFIGDHLFYFTAETLTMALKLNGFDVLDCSNIWHDYILSAVVQKRQPLDLSSFTQQQMLLKQKLEKYLDRFPDKQVAVWGAGHQALAVIALTDIAAKICYVVDSAPFKQGKYTPSTHIRIVPPGMLDTNPPAAVIVMAAAYSDEFANNLRKN